MTKPGENEAIDDRQWYAEGVWVAADDEALLMMRSDAAAREVVRDHNGLVDALAAARRAVAAEIADKIEAADATHYVDAEFAARLARSVGEQ